MTLSILPFFNTNAVLLALVKQNAEAELERAKSVAKPILEKVEVTVDEKNHIVFFVSLMVAAAHSDGEKSTGEHIVINEIINNLQENYFIENNFKEHLISLLHEKTSIKQLRNRFATLRNITDDELKFYRDLVHTVISNDHEINDFEKAFQFKMELIFEDLPDLELYLMTNEKNLNVSNDIAYQVSLEEITLKFPETNLNKISKASFLTKHPSNCKELVGFDIFFEDSFAESKDTELVEAARLAGAESIKIRSVSKELNSSKLGASVSAEVTIAATKNAGGGNAKFETSKLSDIEELQELEFKFEGIRPGFLSDFNGKNADNILKKSKWLQHDPNLVAFVKSCFGNNRVKTFSQKVNYVEVGNSMLSASIAAKCKLTLFKGKLESGFDKKAEKIMKRELEYSINFK